MTATSATELTILCHADGGGQATGTADGNPFRSGAAAAPGRGQHGAVGSSAMPVQTVRIPTGEDAFGGATLTFAEAGPQPRGKTVPLISAVVRSACGAHPPSAGPSAVWQPPEAEADLVVAPIVHLTSSRMGSGVKEELYSGYLFFVDCAD